MVLSFWFVAITAFLVCLQVLPALSRSDPSIPVLPNFFSGYAESITNVEGSESSVTMSRSFYDMGMNLARLDLAGETFTPTSLGTISSIQDASTGVMYTVNRQYSNCTISIVSATPLYSLGRYKLRSLNDLFLLSSLNYSYAGNMSAHGLVLDNWMYSGAFSHGGYDYTSSKLQWSITQSGQSVSSISSVSTNPTPWRLSIDGLVTSSDDASTMNISSVTRYFDLTFEEPSFDVFDTSICVDTSDALFLALAIPGGENGIDLSQFRGNVRRAVSDYAQVFPIQIGNVEITSTNGTFIFVSLQLSNLTSKASVENRKTALEAYEAILNNTVNGQAPFQVQISSGNMVTPYVELPSTTQNCQDVISSITTVSPSTTIPDSILTSTPSMDVTVTITVTVTPSCSMVPTQSPTSPATCPPSTGSPVGVAQSRVIGIAFGTLITGSFVSCIGMVMCFLCYQKTRTRTWSPSLAGYQKQPDSVADKEYFQ